jgi:hypothetical protein
MAKASVQLTTNPPASLAVNLDSADRRALVLACCNQLFILGMKDDIGHWRQRAATWDWYELLLRAQELGVVLKQGNQEYQLPEELAHR